jgi:hypothetical protein
MTCTACAAAETAEVGGGVYMRGCHGCDVRFVARMPPVRRQLALDAVSDANREAFTAEVRTEFARIRALRRKQP